MDVRGDYLNSGAIVWMTAAVVIALTSAVVYVYDRYYAKKAALFFGRNKVLWTALVIVMSIAACVWAYHGTQEFPNLVNDYDIGE
jgi:magnesium-transporting ATPase (P-type)